VRILVCGGCGFIGSHFVRILLAEEPSFGVTNLDKLTYAGNPANLADVTDSPRYRFVQGDICEPAAVEEACEGCSAIVNFAAETHVDRSVLDSEAFLRTDVLGVRVLLEQARASGVERMIQVSTDEVYGNLSEGSANEHSAPRPRNPYAASKAAGDLLALSYFTSHGVPVCITRACNNYGPNQYPEKMLPLFATNALDDKPLPLYGDGKQVRDWLHVEDHCRALLTVLQRGEAGLVYNIGASEEHTNLEVAELLLETLGKPLTLLRHVEDRPGHDRRYSLQSERVRALGWQPHVAFEEGIRASSLWYRDHRDWWEPLRRSPDFQAYYERQYAGRLGAER
jgi:dTDP-glucose 4,6-dehydratase